MIHTLDDYICRSIDLSQTFMTNPNLCKKVNEQGEFLPFVGNTVVFDLDEKVKSCLSSLQDELYTRNEQVLSSRLNPNTFHMTLHDLVNGTPDDATVKDRMNQVSPKVRQILAQLKEEPSIYMRATWMFNMVNTSIVLGLKPVDDDSLSRLDRMYCSLEDVVRLGYPLCPHITLAYFRSGVYTPEQMATLKKALRPVDLSVSLDIRALQLQNFEHMNAYYQI